MLEIQINNCPLVYQCPKTWERLTITPNPDVRYCEECSKNVHYCYGTTQVEEYLNRGYCIAVKPGLYGDYNDKYELIGF